MIIHCLIIMFFGYTYCYPMDVEETDFAKIGFKIGDQTTYGDAKKLNAIPFISKMREHDYKKIYDLQGQVVDLNAKEEQENIFSPKTVQAIIDIVEKTVVLKNDEYVFPDTPNVSVRNTIRHTIESLQLNEIALCIKGMDYFNISEKIIETACRTFVHKIKQTIQRNP